MAVDRPVLLTGAAGALGSLLRPHLARRKVGLRSSDIRDIGPALDGETVVLTDLSDATEVDRAVAGVGAIVHFGAVSVEDRFDAVLPANVIGTYNVLEAARRHGVTRVVFASSIHVVGFYPTTERIDAEAPLRPDSLYGVSKAFGENLAKLYVEKAAMDVACLRIGVVAEKPTTPRNLWTWLSPADLARLVDTCLDAPPFGFTVVYGISANSRSWWDNARSAVPFSPLDNAENHVRRLLPNGDDLDPIGPGGRFHGGPFVALELGERPSSAPPSPTRI